LIDKKKNNSTANLFKWSKPTVMIKIAQDDTQAQNSSNNSMNGSLIGKNLGAGNQILQSSVSSKFQK
jgi:hypothetical protein